MKLKTKLILLAAVPLTGLAVTVATFYVRARALEKMVHHTTTESAVYAALAQHLQFNVVQVQQFLQDVSATRGLDGLNDGFRLAAAQRDEFLAGTKRFKEMYEREQDQTNLEKVATLEAAFARCYEAGHAMASAYVKDGPAGGNKMMADFDKVATRMIEELETFVKQQTDEFNDELSGVETSSKKTASTAVIGGLILTVGTLFLTFYWIRSVTGVLSGVTERLSSGATQTGAAAHEVSSSSQSLAEGASEQAASLEETSASLEEISAMTKRNSDNAASSKTLTHPK